MIEDFLTNSFFDLSTFPFRDLFEKVKYPWDALLNIEDFIISNRDKFLNEGYLEKEKNFLIDKSVEFDTRVKIEGVGLIGKNSKISDNVCLRDGVIIGVGAQIGHAVEIKHSIILDCASVAHLNYVGDSVIGNSVNISGGAILANLRFDKKDIRIYHGDNYIDTGLQKLGSIVGDNSQIGVNSVLNPGTILGKNSLVFPLVSAKGVNPTDSIIKS